MRQYDVEAVVLRSKTIREADKLVTIFSRQRGKQRVMAYGAAKANSRKRGAVQPLCHSQMMLSRGKVLDSITQCAGISFFTEIVSNLEKMTVAFYFCELMDILNEENEPNEPLFILLLTTLKWLNQPTIDFAAVEKLQAGFEMKMLGLLGYMPELGSCVNCGGDLTGKLTFSVDEGGVICGHCYQPENRVFAIKYPTVQLLRQLLTTKPGELALLQPDKWTFEQTKNILKALTRYHLERRAKSLDFLEVLHKNTPNRDK
ncbi:DNA repair protein RecO [Peptococcaceae bacterium 1198_IL3148]